MKDEELIENLSHGILKRGMEAPAIFALEMYKPLAGVLYNLSMAVFPMLTAVFGLDKVQEIIQIMRNPESVERLIQALENKNLREKA
jgi:hypothetical protein